MTTSNLDIPSDLYLQRVAPDYTDDIVNISFESELHYQAWFDSVAVHHAAWTVKSVHVSEANRIKMESFQNEDRYIMKLAKETSYLLCDHGGKYKKKSVPVQTPETPETSDTPEMPAKKTRKTRESIKVGCTARFTKTLFFNGEVEIKYTWKHTNHNPLEVSDMVSSKLPAAIRLWIKKQVDSNMDWKAIKASLRMSEQSLDNVSYIKAILFIILIHKLFSLICQTLFLGFLLV